MTVRGAPKVLVLGGTGLIGNAVVRNLIAQKYAVTVVSRRSEKPANLVDVDADYLCGDVDDSRDLDRWIAGHEIVVDAAAPYALNLFHAGSAAERRPVAHARERTRALLDSIIKHGARLAYVSTLSGRHLREGSAFAALQSRFVHRLQPYFEIKALIEDAIVEASRGGLRATIVRPSACLGPWDIKPRRQCWIPALLSGELSLSLQHRINVVDTRDVAATLVAALGSEIYGKPIAVTGHNTTVNDLFSAVCEVAGVSHPRWSLPAAFGMLPALWAEFAWGLVGRPSPLPSLVPMLLCEQEWLQLDPMQLTLADKPQPLVETVRDTIDWYRRIGYC